MSSVLSLRTIEPEAAPETALDVVLSHAPLSVVEDAPADRRGPLRPDRLISTKRRMNGEAVSACSALPTPA